MIDKSIAGLVKKESSLLREVIEKDEPKANETEILIEDLCTTMIAQYEPKAKNLENNSHDDENEQRSGTGCDHAVNIAECSLYIIERPAIKPLLDIPENGRGGSWDAEGRHCIIHIKEDALLAAMVCERDTIVDNLGQQILRGAHHLYER